MNYLGAERVALSLRCLLCKCEDPGLVHRTYGGVHSLSIYTRTNPSTRKAGTGGPVGLESSSLAHLASSKPVRDFVETKR